MRPVIGVSACRKTPGDHPVHQVSEKYVTCIADAAGAVPVVVPALGAGRIDLDSVLATLDGVFLTGSPSNVEPHHYDGAPADADSPADPDRDSTTLPLIAAALAAGVPVFCVCRGIQELNVALGGTLHQKVHDRPGTFDHRARKDVPFDDQYRFAHAVEIAPGGMLERLVGRRRVLVNSLHGQAIDRPAERLRIEARADDGVIEAASVEGARAFALGVQWHPEWPDLADPVSKALFEAFGAAAADRAARRHAGKAA